MGESKHPWHEHIWEKIPGLIDEFLCVLCQEYWNANKAPAP